MSIGFKLSSGDINALAHDIDTEAAQLRHAGQEGSERWAQLVRQLEELQKECPHENKHDNVCIDCGASV